MEININNDLQLDETQAAAIEMCLDPLKRLTSVSGPAGSGKTTIIRTVYNALMEQGIPVVLCAPTGKAARRIKEATGIDAMTIHKLLEYNRPGERDEKTGAALDITRPKRDRQNPLTYKVILADEYAMVPYALHDNLIAALPAGGKLCAFGDVHQLPPIEDYRITNSSGTNEITPFKKLLAREGQSIALTKVYRQGEGSAILEAANKIRIGHTPLLNTDLNDLYIKLTDKPLEILKMHVLKSLEAGVSYAKIENQIITPQKKSWVGTIKLNGMLRMLLNPRPEQELDLPRHKWDKDPLKVGLNDKIVCTENMYDLRSYFERYSEWTAEMKPVYESYIPCPDTKQMLNGETGIITHIYPDGGVDIDFGDRTVEVPMQYEEYWSERDTIIETQPLRGIDLAYALTTHKCQGSEFQQVCYVLNKSTQFSQSRQNFYTALTRAKKRAMVIGDQVSLRVSIMKVKV